MFAVGRVPMIMSLRSDPERLSIISVEGNWNEEVNARRLQLAADAFASRKADFIIVSGTCDPTQMEAPRAGVEKLGQKNARVLKNIYGVDAARIVPVHAFPFAFTYTTIEAYGNACAIGWLACGLRPLNKTVHVDFLPITSGAHRCRVNALNIRACSALRQFNVSTIVHELPADGEIDSAEFIASEAEKLARLHDADGVIKSGRWRHGSEEWSMDDPANMRAMSCALFTEVFPALDREMANRLVEGTAAGTSSIAGRCAVMQLVCLASSKVSLTSAGVDSIANHTRTRFQRAFDEAGFRYAVEILAGS